MATTEGPFPMETTYTWSDSAASGHTEPRSVTAGPHLASQASPRPMAAAMKRANRKDLAALKTLLERQ